MNSSDATLWDKLRNGHKSSFDLIYNDYINVLFNYGRRFTSDQELIEDCIQDFFTDLWVKRDRLSATNQIKPYLLLSLKRRLLRQIAKDSKKEGIDGYQDFLIEFSREDELINQKVNAERIDKLNSTMDKLTPRQKEAIYLKFFEGLSYTDIAEIMNVETKAVYKLMARAIEGLKSEFQVFLLLVCMSFEVG
ncbi:MAG: sigma-70 family RNA polymerase sigma factor [Cyclobacteriaceae bacterium]